MNNKEIINLLICDGDRIIEVVRTSSPKLQQIIINNAGERGLMVLLQKERQ